jgi:hypothetical protein
LRTAHSPQDRTAKDHEVRKWTDKHLGEAEFIVRLSDAVTSVSWVSGVGIDGMGDRVSQGVPYVQMEGLETILDVSRFLSRVAEIEASAMDDRSKNILARFREGMRRREEEQSRRQPAAEANTQEESGVAEEEKDVFRAALNDGEE